jgi:hypothetical protein
MFEGEPARDRYPPRNEPSIIGHMMGNVIEALQGNSQWSAKKLPQSV